MTLRASAMGEPMEWPEMPLDGCVPCEGGCGRTVDALDRFCMSCGPRFHDIEMRRILADRARRAGEQFFALDRVDAGVCDVGEVPAPAEHVDLFGCQPMTWRERAKFSAMMLAAFGLSGGVGLLLWLGAKVLVGEILGVQL